MNSKKLMLREISRLIAEEKEAILMITFFVGITEGLNEKKDNGLSLNPINHQTVNDVLEKFKDHPCSHKNKINFFDKIKVLLQIFHVIFKKRKKLRMWIIPNLLTLVISAMPTRAIWGMDAFLHY